MPFIAGSVSAWRSFEGRLWNEFAGTIVVAFDEKTPYIPAAVTSYNGDGHVEGLRIRMKHIVFAALVLVTANSVFAGEDMAMMAQESRERVFSALTKRLVKPEIANSVADLQSTDFPTRENAAKKLAAESDRKAVIDALIAAAREDDANKRPNAGSLLVEMRADSIQPLIAALDANETRSRAAWALSEMGEDAKAAIPALTALLKNENANAVMDAAKALGSMGAAAKPSIPALIDAMTHPNQEARSALAEAIKRAGPGPEYIPKLIPLLDDKFMQVRSTIILTFGYMGEAGKPTIPIIAKHLKDENAWCRMHAAASLARFGPDAKETAAALKEALSDSADNVRGAAANAIARVAPSAEIVPDLIGLAQDKNERVSNKACEALVLIGTPALKDLKEVSEATDDAVLKALLGDVMKKIQAAK
jgi:HEAT repeat protein